MLGKKILILVSLFMVVSTSQESVAARGGNTNQEVVPKIYTKRAKALLNELATDELLDKERPLTDSQQQEFKEILKQEDKFLYNQPEMLKITNKVIPVSLSSRKIIKIKLGHSYNTTVIFTDSLGNPWTASTLSDMSNDEVVSYVEGADKGASHIFTFKPKKLSGQTNIPIKLAGEQYPLMLLFDVNSEEAYFNVDIKIDALGDSSNSQQAKSMNTHNEGNMPSPLLSPEPEIELMLQKLTPDGFAKHDIRDSYGDRVDERDFSAWTNNGRLFIMTPHDDYSPQPVHISAASDGRHKLFEYKETSVVLMRKNSQIVMLYIK